MANTSTQRSTVEIKIPSAGATKPGLANLTKSFEEETGHKVAIIPATAPVLRGKVEAKEAAADVVVAPVPAMKDFEKNRRIVAGSSTVLGTVRATVVIRNGAPEPDIYTTEVLKRKILTARSLVYNEAS